jgi:26S proteasome regulatory subunit N7
LLIAGFCTHFCRSELFSYTSCVSYAVASSLISLDRVPLKSRVVDSPEIRSVIGHVPALESCLNALYDCNYKEFFKVCVVLWCEM